jgi:uracil-DNA glycosylase
MIDTNRHRILRAAHPSPKAADRGFFGCRHFSRINQHLTERNEAPIDWTLPA